MATARLLAPTDAPALEQAFPRDGVERAWRGNAPGGARAWGVFDGDGARAWCTHPLQRVWMGGAERTFCELDELRGLGTGAAFEPDDERAFWRTSADESFGREHDFVQFAFPSAAAWEDRQRFEGFDIVRTQHVLVRDVLASDAAPTDVRALEGFDHRLRWLWDRCAGGFGASAIRDEAFLRWRFGPEAPGDFRVLVVPGEGDTLRGLAVYARAEWLTPASASLVDWLVPEEEEEVGATLLAAVAAHARADGASAVTTLLVEWSPWFERLQRAGYVVHPSPLFPVARSAARRFDHLWLRDHWWYTLADTTLI